MSDGLIAAGLLVVSNTFMTMAWYGHLRFKGLSLPVAILMSWGIAFFEYLVQVPANRIGYRVLSAYQLKVMQEAITMVAFVLFDSVWIGEDVTTRLLVSFALVVAVTVVDVWRFYQVVS